MVTFLGFILGQLFAVITQAALWVSDARGWGDYFKKRRHQAQHVIDVIASLMLFFAWGTGLLVKLADLFPDPIPTWIAKLPSTPTGPIVAMVTGYLFCLGTWWGRRRWFKTPEPPPLLAPKEEPE